MLLKDKGCQHSLTPFVYYNKQLLRKFFYYNKQVTCKMERLFSVFVVREILSVKKGQAFAYPQHQQRYD